MKVVVIENNSRYLVAVNVALKVARSIKETIINTSDKFVVVRITKD